MKTNRIRQILESEKFECLNIAILYHLILILILTLIVNHNKINESVINIVSSPIEEVIIDHEINLPVENFDPVETSINHEDINVSDSSLNTNSEIQTPSAIEIDSIENAEPSLVSDYIGETISGIGANIGTGISNESSTGSALDRLTIEIIDNAQTKDLNVVWLFDASISLNFQRQQIKDRFDKIIEELGFAENTKNITHCICSFGQSIQFITEKPTDKASVLKADMDKIVLDESGIENTFNAIGQVCKKYTKYGSRLMIIVFTDEVGDDINLLDAVSALCINKVCPVYVVGSPSPFGKSTTQFKFVEFDPEYRQEERWVQIQQGPESLYDLILDIKTLPIDDETLDSGFGPFALSKLCLDTSGIYFSVHPNRSSSKVGKQQISPLSSYISRFFDHDIMRMYKPDYRSVASQTKIYQTHKTIKSLVQASQIPLKISDEQTLRFKAYNEGMFAQELSMAQRFSAKVEPKINEIYNILLNGESSANTLDDKRIIASYYLAMGRILATKCRIESYNLVLAEAKTGLKKSDPKTNIWILIPSPEFKVSNSVLNKQYNSSQKYLQYVIDNFPNTPWALIAHQELNTPFGYRWVEHYEEPPKMGDGGNGNNNPKDDMAKPKLIPKPQRKIDKI